jgi:hypothetical protein
MDPIKELPEDFVKDIQETGLCRLGAMNKSAIEKAADISAILSAKGIHPKSLFLDMIADRLTDKISKNSATIILSGPLGSGKSYAAIGMAYRLSLILAERLKHPATDFFTLKNSAILSDPEGINELLKNSRKHQIILIDDSGVAFGNRDFFTKKSKDFNRLMAIARPMRWLIIFTTPLRSQIDLQLRQFANWNGSVYFSAHQHGFSILKMYSVDVKEIGGNQTFTRKVILGGKKMDFLVFWGPPKELADEYDKLREATARRIIGEGGSLDHNFKKDKSKMKNVMKTTKERSHDMKKYLQQNPGSNLKETSVRFGLNYMTALRANKKLKQEKENGTTT